MVKHLNIRPVLAFRLVGLGEFMPVTLQIPEKVLGI